MGVTFPGDVRTSYLIHDGQRPEGFNLLDGYELLSLDRMVDEWRMWKQLLDERDLDYESEPQGPIRTDWWNPLWIPIASDGSGNHLCLDLAPTPAGYLGQISSMWHDGPERELISNSFAEGLEQLADDFQAGKYVLAEEYGGLVRRDTTWGYSNDRG